MLPSVGLVPLPQIVFIATIYLFACALKIRRGNDQQFGEGYSIRAALWSARNGPIGGIVVVVLGAWVQAGVYRAAQNDSYTLAGRTRWIPRG